VGTAVEGAADVPVGVGVAVDGGVEGTGAVVGGTHTGFPSSS
jgi:hypothetical protein